MNCGEGVLLSQRMSQVCLQTPAACRLDSVDSTQSSGDQDWMNGRWSNGQQDEATDVLCSQDFFSTPDFLTPVENQFHVGFSDNPKVTAAAVPLSPAGLTPFRAKRQRGETTPSTSGWSDDDILSSQPEPPQLQLPATIFPPNNALPNQPFRPPAPLGEATSVNSLDMNEDSSRQPAKAPSVDKPVLAYRISRCNVPPLVSLGTESLRPALPPAWKSSQGNGPAGKPHASRDRIAYMRRRVQSPPCMPNPFLVDMEVAKANGSQGMAVRPASNGVVVGPNGYSRYKEEFHEIEEIGKGNFSRVFKVLKRIDGCLYAVKRTIREFRHESERKQALMEVQALAAIGTQENILRYYTAWVEHDHLFIQTELCEGSLARILKVDQSFSEKDLTDFLGQMAAALTCIHARGIVHLDVKPDNIYTVKGSYRLGDFGRATRVDGSTTVEEGDARYMPLEILNNDLSDLTKVDMFSLGASAYELARMAPLPTSGAAFQSIREGKIMLLPGYSTTLQSLIKALLNPDPSCRPSARELRKRLSTSK